MARVKARQGHQLSEIGRVIVAAWWKVLPDSGNVTPRPACPPLDLPGCHDLCRSKGLRFVVVDLTRPGCGTPVVRVVVPGLRPKWARFAPGRLYDVPVQMGWRTTPSLPAELNPLPLPG